jgi:surfeit locus 1 family protein
LAVIIAHRRFAPRLWSTLLTLALIAVFVSLGRWQLARAEQKRVLFAEFAAGTDATIALSSASAERLARYQHVRAAGRYDGEHQFLLDNMTHNEQAGFRVLTPFRLEGGRTVLVDRGWFPLGRNRTDWPALAIAAGVRDIRGRIDDLPVPGIRLSGPATEATPNAWPRLVNYPERPELETALATQLYPHIVLLDSDQTDGFVRDWTPPGFPPVRHIGYAVQWFALAFTLAVLYVILNLHQSEPESLTKASR